MLVQPLPTGRRSPLAAVPLAPALATESDVAVMVNRNARQVGDRAIEALSQIVAPRDLFVSRSFLDLRSGVRQMLERGYSTVFCGGGDGTLMALVNEFDRQLAGPRSVPSVRPRFGILRLGTGNSLASLVQASPARGCRFVGDVARAQAGEATHFRRLDLLSVEGKSAPFAGVGVDGQVLNDYVALKRRVSDGPLKALLTGPGGYFSSVVTRTLPRCLTRPVLFDCEVVNGSKGPAYRLGAGGQSIEELAPGALMYRGRALMAAASTVPCYGFDLRMFPFAGQRRGMMQLRIGEVTPTEALFNLGQLWKGRWEHPGLHDFHATEVRIRFDQPQPLQIGGDGEGYRDDLTLGMSEKPIELLDLGRPTGEVEALPLH